jgi:shikimate kinase
VRDRVVVATGGGALVRTRNMDLARAAGPVVYLKLAPAVLAARLAGDPAPRPLLLGPDGAALAPDELEARVRTLLAEREPAYRRADVIVLADRLTPEGAAAEIVDALRRRARAGRR